MEVFEVFKKCINKGVKMSGGNTKMKKFGKLLWSNATDVITAC